MTTKLEYNIKVTIDLSVIAIEPIKHAFNSSGNLLIGLRLIVY